MLRVLLVISCLAGGWPIATAIADASRYSADIPSAFMRSFGTTPPPFGYVRFCLRDPSHCQAGTRKLSRPRATPLRLSELDAINRLVNGAIEPVTDAQLYGQEEYWTMPNTKGDCEDYALLKRKMLIERGWPASALLLTVVRDELGDGHAVLTVRTSQGDFILDNKVAEVLRWHETGYHFIMRQSYVDPQQWRSLDPGANKRSTMLTSQP